MMRPAAFTLALGLLLAAPALAQTAVAPATPACRMSDEPPLPDAALPLARAAVASTGRLAILGIGGAPMAGAAAQDPEATYLARLRTHLQARLPGVQITVVNHAVARRSAQGMARRLAEDLPQVHPSLVIWESGGREAATGADFGVYARVLEDGVQQIHAAGADVILMDTQFAPGFSGLVNLGPYRDIMRTAAEMQNATLFPRHDLMAAWNEAGVVNLEAEQPPAQLAATRALFDCLGDRLAAMIARALR